MASTSSLPKAVVPPSTSEVIDVDEEEPNIVSKVCTDETSNDADHDLAMETEKEPKNDKNQNAIDDQKLNELARNEQKAVEEISFSTKDVLVYNNGGNNASSSNRQPIKLEDVRNFDILLPDQKNYNGVRKAKKDFYDGFVWYRKLVDKVRPAFMECNTIDEKFKVSKWLIQKAKERGGRFLKENRDGTSGVCRVMTMEDTLQYTMVAFEDEKPWTTIASCLEGNEEADPPFPRQSQEIDLDSTLKSKDLEQQQTKTGTALESQSSLKKTSEAEISNSNQELLATAKTAISDSVRPSSEPPPKKPKILATADKPLGSTSTSNADISRVQKAPEKALKAAETHKISLALQTCLMERQMIREELIENQEILLMRQDRLSRLETEFRLFQNRQLFLPSEQWLTEKILRQEELFENRELLGIQQQRCRRLQTLMELNERQVFEHQSSIEREKLKLENLQSISKEESPLENGVREKDINKITAVQYAQAKRATEIDLIDNNNKVKATIDEMKKKKLQQQLAARRMIDQHVALETEMNRRHDQKKAMEQEIEYRVAMEHAVQRQAEMKKAMKARQLMMSRAGMSQQSPEILTERPLKGIEDVKNTSPDLTESVGKTDNTRKENEESENEIIIGSDQGVSLNGWEGDGSDVEEDGDDDSIVI